jgi:hypothetical protein
MAKKEEKGAKTKKGGKVLALFILMARILHLLLIVNSAGGNCFSGGLPRN